MNDNIEYPKPVADIPRDALRSVQLIVRQLHKQPPAVTANILTAAIIVHAKNSNQEHDIAGMLHRMTNAAIEAQRQRD